MFQMIKGRIGSALIAAAALAHVPIPALAETEANTHADASPVQIRMAVDFYFGGLQIGTADLHSRVYSDHYEMVSTGRGTGLASLFTGGRHGTVEAVGTINNGDVSPQVYSYTYGTDEQVEQQTKVMFAPDQPVTITSTPEYTEERRKHVPLEEQIGTLDPLSSALFHLTLGAGATPCGETVRIFDGRRRFDLHTKFVDTTTLRQSRYNAYGGEAIECQAIFERIKGFDEDTIEIAPRSGKERIKRKSKTYDPATVWLAPIQVRGGTAGETMLMPVKVKAVTSYGTIMVHVREYEVKRLIPDAQASLQSETSGQID